MLQVVEADGDPQLTQYVEDMLQDQVGVRAGRAVGRLVGAAVGSLLTCAARSPAGGRLGRRPSAVQYSTVRPGKGKTLQDQAGGRGCRCPPAVPLFSRAPWREETQLPPPPLLRRCQELLFFRNHHYCSVAPLPLLLPRGQRTSSRPRATWRSSGRAVRTAPCMSALLTRPPRPCPAGRGHQEGCRLRGAAAPAGQGPR